MLAPSQQKDQKNQTNPEKMKENPFGPWPSLPSAVQWGILAHHLLSGPEGPEPALGRSTVKMNTTTTTTTTTTRILF
jgi:hypothetical protein